MYPPALSPNALLLVTKHTELSGLRDQIHSPDCGLQTCKQMKPSSFLPLTTFRGSNRLTTERQHLYNSQTVLPGSEETQDYQSRRDLWDHLLKSPFLTV